MNTEEFRAALLRLELSQGALARMFTELGDPASPITVRRRVERWAQGASTVPGEVTAFLTILERFPKVLASLRPPVKAS
jgi:hypothetical protein